MNRTAEHATWEETLILSSCWSVSVFRRCRCPAIAEDEVLEFAGGYLFGKAADFFFDKLDGKPDLHALNRYLHRLEVWKPQYSNEIRNLREQIAGIKNREEYNQRMFATVDRLEQKRAGPVFAS